MRFRIHRLPGTLFHTTASESQAKGRLGFAGLMASPMRIDHRLRLDIKQNRGEIKADAQDVGQRNKAGSGEQGSGDGRLFVGFTSPRRNNHFDNRSRIGVGQT
jgi:hypothetical protein